MTRASRPLTKCIIHLNTALSSSCRDVQSESTAVAFDSTTSALRPSFLAATPALHASITGTQAISLKWRRIRVELLQLPVAGLHLRDDLGGQLRSRGRRRAVPRVAGRRRCRRRVCCSCWRRPVHLLRERRGRPPRPPPQEEEASPSPPTRSTPAAAAASASRY
jgi:hypothetical protein